MTKKELINKNIGITFDFLRYVVDHPEMLDSIPNGAELSFIDKDMPTPLEENGKSTRRVMRYKVEHIFEPVALKG
jgi:hypothetical protein